MKIGFDLDGVLCDTDLNFLRLMAHVFEEDRQKLIEMETLYFNNRSPLLNPENFLSEGDEYYIITGRSHKYGKEVTEEWCKGTLPMQMGSSAWVNTGSPLRRTRFVRFWNLTSTFTLTTTL